MDPNANLIEQLRIAKQIMSIWDDCEDDGTLSAEQATTVTEQANRLAELVDGLDGWLKAGGFKPARWT